LVISKAGFGQNNRKHGFFDVVVAVDLAANVTNAEAADLFLPENGRTVTLITDRFLYIPSHTHS